MKAIRHFHFGANTPTKDEKADHEAKTVVILDCPTSAQLISFAQNQLNAVNGQLFPLQVGVAMLHPQDHYNKKIGVKIATQKAESSGELYFKLNFEHVNNRLYLSFKNSDTEHQIKSIDLLVDKQSKYPEIINIGICKKKQPWEFYV